MTDDFEDDRECVSCGCDRECAREREWWEDQERREAEDRLRGKERWERQSVDPRYEFASTIGGKRIHTPDCSVIREQVRWAEAVLTGAAPSQRQADWEHGETGYHGVWPSMLTRRSAESLNPRTYPSCRICCPDLVRAVRESPVAQQRRKNAELLDAARRRREAWPEMDTASLLVELDVLRKRWTDHWTEHCASKSTPCRRALWLWTDVTNLSAYLIDKRWPIPEEPAGS